MPSYTVNTDRKKFVGYLWPNGVFKKNVRKSLHLHRTLDSWAISTRIVKKLVKAKCHTVEITDIERGVKYTCGIEKFVDGLGIGWEDQQKAVERKEFKQVIL